MQIYQGRRAQIKIWRKENLSVNLTIYYDSLLNYSSVTPSKISCLCFPSIILGGFRPWYPWPCFRFPWPCPGSLLDSQDLTSLFELSLSSRIGLILDLASDFPGLVLVVGLPRPSLDLTSPVGRCDIPRTSTSNRHTSLSPAFKQTMSSWSHHISWPPAWYQLYK